jgi:hypothetical protein
MGLAGPRSPHLADAADLIAWATRIMSRADLARLLRSLIDQTNDQVTVLEMRAGEGAELPGYDGIVVAAKGSPFVPEGRSVWELGTGGDPNVKASDDYRKRTKNPLGEDRARTTFVFVTPLRWEGKDAWIKRRRKKSPWLDIRVFDVDNIEQALENAPGAHLIFSDRINKPALGVRGIEKWWQAFSAASNPALTPAMVLAGRDDDAVALSRLLEQEVRQTTISATGLDDALAFVSAVLMSEEEDRRLGLLSRTLVVYEAHALRLLDDSAKLLILLPFDESLHREAHLLRSHHVLLLAPYDSPADVQPRRIDQQRFAALLMAAGMEEQRARLLARAASRSLVAFQRQASTAGIALRPEWTRWLRAKPTRRAWLAGGWNEDRGGDIDVLTKIVGEPYDDASTALRDATQGVDPLLTRVGGVWGTASSEAAWDFVVPLLEAADLRSIESAIETVLGAIDPALNLPPEKRWASAVYGKSRIHSASLRTGLATTLALLGAYGESVDLSGGMNGRAWAQNTVRRLLRRANGDETAELWASLDDVMSLLAEAAPDEFVGAVITGTSA